MSSRYVDIRMSIIRCVVWGGIGCPTRSTLKGSADISAEFPKRERVRLSSNPHPCHHPSASSSPSSPGLQSSRTPGLHDAIFLVGPQLPPNSPQYPAISRHRPPQPPPQPATGRHRPPQPSPQVAVRPASSASKINENRWTSIENRWTF